MIGSKLWQPAVRASITLTGRRSFASTARKLQVYENVDQEFIMKHCTSDSSKVVLLDFYADWCGPCKMLSPSLRKAATHPELVGGIQVDLLTIDVDAQQDLARQFKVSSMPTVIAMKNGKPVAKFIGMIPEKKVFDFVQNLPAE